MTQLRLGVIAACLACAIAAPAQSQAPARATATPGDPWRWQGRPGDPRELVLKLVRGSARIVRRPGPVELAIIHSSPSGADSVRLEVEEQAQSVTFIDQYPASRLRPWTECLPPENKRGAFWDSDVELDATIYAPEGVPVRVEIMDRRPGASPAV